MPARSHSNIKHPRSGTVARRLAGGALALAALMLSACAASGTVTEDAVAQGAAASHRTAEAPARATPQRLDITPASVEYISTDPAFEALPGARAIFGSDGGATYQIEVPDRWNGEAVFFAHGYRASARELTVSVPPTREHLIERGYAWAASSYSRNGYDPGAGAADTLRLKEIFTREVGPATRSYVYGQSMGGHIVALLMEQHAGAFDGAIAECGSIGGSGILDYFVSWGMLSGYMAGVDLSSTAADGRALAARFGDTVLPALGGADAPTEAGAAFRNVIMHLTGGERPFFGEGYAIAFAMNFSVLEGAVAMPGAANAAAQNADAVYEIDEGLGLAADRLNAEVPRVQANPGARDALLHPDFADNSGRISAPVLTLHNTGDLFVPIHLEQAWRRAVDRAGRGDLLVQRAIRRPGHCNFSAAERERAFDDLVAWVAGGPRPAGDDLLAPLADAGLAFTDPPEPRDPGR